MSRIEPISSAPHLEPATDRSVRRVRAGDETKVFFTIGWAALLLHEEITPLTLLATVIVVVMVAIGRRAPIQQ